MSEDLSHILHHVPETVIDAPDVRDHIPSVGNRAARSSIDEMLAMPGLEEFSPGPSNQGDWGSCTAHAGVNGTKMVTNRYVPGSAETLNFSPEAGYNAFREMVGKLNEDNGLTMRDFQKGLRDRGLVPKGAWHPAHWTTPPPPDYDKWATKYPDNGYYNMPLLTDEGGRFPEGTNYSLRLWLEWNKIERLPIFIATKIPVHDMRSPYVRKTGFRSFSPYKSHDDPGYWHAEVVEDIVRIDGTIYVVALGSWGWVGRKGRFLIPWVNLLDRLYAGLAFAPKRGWA